MIRHVSFGILFSAGISVSLSQDFTPAIEDNSYYIEEAYNQETNVVQHISTGYYEPNAKEFIYTFTQEWPFGSQDHQISYTIPVSSLHPGGTGFGDILLNYRYQLYEEHDPFWCSPRLSLSLPTGSAANGHGMNAYGVQVNVPVSKRWSNEWISHFNLGSTSFFNVEGSDASGALFNQTLTSLFAGTSVIYLMSEHFNIMLELLYNDNAGFDLNGNVSYRSQTILSPGIRYAVDVNALQIVPGIALPVTFDNTNTVVGIFAYLSFEHPF